MKKMQIINLTMCLVIGLLGCGKSKSIDSTPYTPAVTTYTDPAQYGTPYASVPAAKDIVMYEVNLKTFSPATFQGVKSRLDSIKALGVNTIWLMPIYPIGVLKAAGSPYAVKDYQDVNASFGSLDDLRQLVNQAHNLGMAVILDWVANHTSWDNAWISNKAWYQQDASGNIIIPPGTNYSDVAALNFSNFDMRAAMIRAMKYWIYTANVDGYRCDFADNIPTDFWKQSLDTLSKIKTHKLIYLAEGTNTTEITAGFQLNFAFSYYNSLKALFAGTQSPSDLFATNNAEQTTLPSPGIKLRYITNHDNASTDGSTLTEYKSKQGALAAFTIAACMGGVPLIYSSQEVGYPNAINFFNNVVVDYSANPDMVAAYKKILAFRAAHEAVKTGALTQFNDANIVAFEKKLGTDDVLILVNIRNSAQTFAMPTLLQNTTWKNGLTGANISLGSQYAFAANEYLVLNK